MVRALLFATLGRDLMIQHYDRRAKYEAADYFETNHENWPTREQLSASFRRFLKWTAAGLAFAVVIGLLCYAGYTPSPEFHG